MPIDIGLNIGRLRFRDTIEGDNPPWRPLHAFADGRKVYASSEAFLECCSYGGT
ncbi:MAG TPA: hypothetical protein VKC66_23360 [Xanthobacteraceae bacterium]|nr:hypothetical protein [Xanthobacteraceae bacterium]